MSKLTTSLIGETLTTSIRETTLQIGETMTTSIEAIMEPAWLTMSRAHSQIDPWF